MTYFQWLCDMIKHDSQEHSYYIFLGRLFEHKFESIVDYDVNRISDGLKLREIFFKETNEPIDLQSDTCTILEMLVGLSERMASIVPEITRDVWFWKIIKNWIFFYETLQDDYYYENDGNTLVDRCVMTLNHRRYSSTGQGGLFPLKKAKEDQRRVEIWYQMQNYISENVSVNGYGDIKERMKKK